MANDTTGRAGKPGGPRRGGRAGRAGLPGDADLPGSEPTDTGPADTGRADTGPADTGPVNDGELEADGAAGAGAARAGAGGAPRQLRPTDVKRLNREWRRRTEGRLALLLDSVSQPFNVGSIVRTAAAFGVESVWLCGNTPDLDLPAVGKTALGTDRFLSAYREPSPAAAAKDAAEDGFRVVAVELASGAVPLFEAPLDGDVCLAIGNEDHGCSPALLAAVSSAAYIPQVGRVGSLNVAVAAAIALAEARRREWTSPPG